LTDQKDAERSGRAIPLARRKLYLDPIPVDEALRRFQDALEQAGWFDAHTIETIASETADGRALAAPVYALVSSPHYPASAMDGVAVSAADTAGASDHTPITLALGSQAIIVDTGDPIPEGYNAVVMWEDLININDQNVTITSAVPPWHHVRMVGEDIVKNELLFPALYQLGPADIGALLAAGVLSVRVLKRPLFALIPTGPELVQPGKVSKPGDIAEYNSAMLRAYLRRWGAETRIYPSQPDDPAVIKACVATALAECDAVCLLAGSSAGRDDYASTVISEFGQILVHGVAAKPGKPVILAVTAPASATPASATPSAVAPSAAAPSATAPSATTPSAVARSATAPPPTPGKPLIGIPGYPVSAATIADLYLAPIVAAKSGRAPLAPSDKKVATARFGRRLESSGGVDEFVQVRLGPVNGTLTALPLSRGAGVISSLARADGRVIIPRGQTGIEAGQTVQVELYRELSALNRQILLGGSHDLTLDIINGRLMRRRPPYSLASAPLGSLGGLMALKRGEALIAGSHLLDPETGRYNVDYANKYLPEMKLIGLSLVRREQGFMVAKGNPLNLKTLHDLTRPGVRFINRQRGSGTRVLLDWLLSREQIDPNAIFGYETEEYTHLAVAAAVSAGSVDAGIGIFAAAAALDLDFIPIGSEWYDLIIPADIFDSAMICALREVLADESFKQEIVGLGGYSVEETGSIRWTT